MSRYNLSVGDDLICRIASLVDFALNSLIALKSSTSIVIGFPSWSIAFFIGLFFILTFRCSARGLGIDSNSCFIGCRDILPNCQVVLDCITLRCIW